MLVVHLCILVECIGGVNLIALMVDVWCDGGIGMFVQHGQLATLRVKLMRLEKGGG